MNLHIRMRGYNHRMNRIVKRKGPQGPHCKERFGLDTIKGRVDAARKAADLTIQELELKAGEPGLYTQHVLPDAYVLGRSGGLRHAIVARRQRIWNAIKRIAPILRVSADYLWGNNPKK